MQEFEKRTAPTTEVSVACICVPSREHQFLTSLLASARQLKRRAPDDYDSTDADDNHMNDVPMQDASCSSEGDGSDMDDMPIRYDRLSESDTSDDAVFDV